VWCTIAQKIGRMWESSPKTLTRVCRLCFRVASLETLAVHPAGGLDLRQPILSGGYTSQIFFYVLLSDVTYRDLRAFAVRDDDTEDALT
jgi:hypothetical protein